MSREIKPVSFFNKMNTKAVANCSNCHCFYIFFRNNVNFDKMNKNLCLIEL